MPSLFSRYFHCFSRLKVWPFVFGHHLFKPSDLFALMMNKVDELLRTPFSQLPLEQKLAIKRLGPYQPKNCSLVQLHGEGKCRRTFCAETWFKKHEWLSYSEDKDALFCFYCLLFAITRDSRRCGYGFRDLQHLCERTREHQSSMEHLGNAVKYQTFGNQNIAAQLDEGHAVSIRRHNIYDRSEKSPRPWSID